MKESMDKLIKTLEHRAEKHKSKGANIWKILLVFR